MIWLYRLLFLPLLLVAAPYYLWRMRRRGGYGDGFGHRFGRTNALPPRAARRRVWLQAVSVGEILAIGPLLEALARDGGPEVYLTTTTSTGYRLAWEKYAHLTIGIGYFPLDFWWFSARAWRAVKPDLAILMEGERWPEHVHQGQTRGVPVIGINARMSDRSFRRSMRFAAVLRPLSRGITRILCASKRDEQRFRALGVDPRRLATTGNLKLDVQIPTLSADERGQLRRELGLGNGLVLLGSSTWPGEEETLLAVLRATRARGLDVSLLLVPRHAERRDALRTLLADSGYRFHLRTTGNAPAPVDVAIADTTGELRRLTQLADLVFVGKSLDPHEGGQTPVEAAILGQPVLLGPNMSNFREIVRSLEEAGAVRRVKNAPELVEVATAMLLDDSARAALSAAARSWADLNRGATARTLTAIGDALSPPA